MGTLSAKLKALSKRFASVDAIVGYTADYAIFVHEDLEAYHPVGQAKFLEEPAKAVTGSVAKKALQQGATLKQAITLEALALQAASQDLCPVDTGNLKGSAFIEVTDATQRS